LLIQFPVDPGLLPEIMVSGHQQPPLSHLATKSCPVIAASMRGDHAGLAMTEFQTLDLILITMGTFACRGRGGFCIRRLFVIGLPLLAGPWVGLRLYTRLDQARFRKVVLSLLLISGSGLIVRGT
jgi:hypothetical protein